MEDLGDNSMKAGEYGIRNLRRILPRLPEWTQEEGDKYDNLEEMYGALIGQFSRYMGHVLKNVGGVYETVRSVEQPGDVFAPAPRARQREAVAFLNAQLFQTPLWLLDDTILNKISSPSGGDPVGSIQTGVLSSLLSASRLNTLIQSASRYGDGNVYSVEDLLSDTHKGMWKELVTHQTITVWRRNLQKTYVESLISILNPPPMPSGLLPGLVFFLGPNTRNTDLPSIVRAELSELRTQIQASLPMTTDRLSKYHLQDLVERIRRALEPK
jgi:hypothetical protein